MYLRNLWLKGTSAKVLDSFDVHMGQYNLTNAEKAKSQLSFSDVAQINQWPKLAFWGRVFLEDFVATL